MIARTGLTNIDSENFSLFIDSSASSSGLLSFKLQCSKGHQFACLHKMPDQLRTIPATCHCGNAQHDITLRASAFPLDSNWCHCTSCRHMTGTLCLTAVPVPPEYAPADSLVRKLTPFDFSSNIRHYFCPTCGTNMFARCIDGPTEVDYVISIGTLEQADASVYRMKAHIFIEDTVDGGFADFVTTFDRFPVKRWSRYFDDDDEDKLLPPHWKAASRRPPAPEDRLHGYCKCRGVEFWISRPSARSAWAKQTDETGTFSADQPLPPESETPWLCENRTKFEAIVCPCDSCRLAGSGMAFAQWASIPAVDMSLDAEGEVPLPKDMAFGTLKSYRTSDRASYHFCAKCGADVFRSADAMPYVKHVGVGLLDSPDGARAESWLKWKTGPLNHREDGLKRAEKLTLAVESGLAEYVKHV